MSPVNPDFEKAISQNNFRGESLVPSPVYIHFGVPEKNQTGFGSRYDLREHNLVSPVKNKGACGCCYAFATIASIESGWLKQGFPLFDLSEEHLRTCHGFRYGTDGCCSGGDIYKSTAYLSRLSGPITENMVPFTGSPHANCAGEITPIAFIDQARFLPKNATDIKQAILDYGAVYSALHYTDNAFRESDNTYYYGGTQLENHAVTIVGWDDNKPTANGTGAWIVKNDFGNGWGENGFFYVSYNDHKILSSNGIFPERKDYLANQTLYFHDKLGHISSTGYGDNTACGLVKFISDGRFPIRKIGTWVNSTETVLDIEIYDNFSNNSLSIKVASMAALVCKYPGYYTFDLPYPLYFNGGNDFYVKIKYTTPDFNYPVPVEAKLENYADPEIESNVAWISHSGSNWSALGANMSNQMDQIDLCIRAWGISSFTEIEQDKDLVCLVYPSPDGEKIRIEAFTNQVLTVNLHNLSGIKIFETQIKSGEQLYEIALPKLNSGIYFVSLFNHQNKIVKKMVIP